MTTPTPQQILDLPLPPNDASAATVRDYLIELLATLWREADLFSGKRPFGYSGWPYEVYPALVTAGYITGRLDEDGHVEDCDIVTADRLIDAAIRSLAPKRAPEPGTGELGGWKPGVVTAVDALRGLDWAGFDPGSLDDLADVAAAVVGALNPGPGFVGVLPPSGD